MQIEVIIAPEGLYDIILTEFDAKRYHDHNVGFIWNQKVSR